MESVSITASRPPAPVHKLYKIDAVQPLQKENSPDLLTLTNAQLDLTNPHHEFWWRTTGAPFATLLEKSGYSLESQRRNLLFYFISVVPALGPSPRRNGEPYWKSFMTDHFSPVEFSWEWSLAGEDPIVRFSFEPIGEFAGSVVDPLNQYAAVRLVQQYETAIAGCDLQWFNHFSDNLISFRQMTTSLVRNRKPPSHQSRMFVAFDLCKDGVVLKAYFLPCFKANDTNTSTLDLITDAVRKLPASQESILPAYNSLLRFLCTSRGSSLEAEIVAIDCIKPEESRLKIYMRNRSTSWSSVRRTMTMNGELDSPGLARGLEDLETLWRLVLGLDSTFSKDAELPQMDHREASILYYFEIRPSKAKPSVKVYIPVRHYGLNDLAITDGLRRYLKSRGRDCLIERYLDALRSFK